MLRLIISAAVGIALGIIGSRFLFVGSAVSLIFWGIVGLLIGYFSRSRREAVVNGSVYGFLLAFVFMLVGYTGSEPAITRIPFFALLGAIGAVCGMVLSFAGNLVTARMRKV